MSALLRMIGSAGRGSIPSLMGASTWAFSWIIRNGALALLAGPTAANTGAIIKMTNATAREQ